MGIYGESIDIFDKFVRRLTDDRKILLQAAWMPGTYAEDPDYGLLVSDLVAADLTPAQLGQFAARVRAQLELDDRLSEARVTATFTPDGVLTARIVLVLEDGEEADFTIAITEENVEVIALAA